ncbi:hypothetical protein AB4876_09415 [Zhongshania guokunii]|uniref:Uncharacterized protein n=1 Tax=Zhongshania guokunii TaxID=641783 RepID=A0ABV3U5X0_9GAMM
MSKSLLVLSTDTVLSAERVDKLGECLRPAVERMGFGLVIADGGLRVGVHHDLSALLAAINAQTESVRKLVESNQALIAAMAADDEYSDDPVVVRYLDDPAD